MMIRLPSHMIKCLSRLCLAPSSDGFRNPSGSMRERPLDGL